MDAYSKHISLFLDALVLLVRLSCHLLFVLSFFNAPVDLRCDKYDLANMLNESLRGPISIPSFTEMLYFLELLEIEFSLLFKSFTAEFSVPSGVNSHELAFRNAGRMNC